MNRGWDRSEKRAREVQSSANRALALNSASGGMKLIFFRRFETHGFFGGFSSDASSRKGFLRLDGFSSLVNRVDVATGGFVGECDGTKSRRHAPRRATQMPPLQSVLHP
jgi:hypothetical protein